MGGHVPRYRTMNLEESADLRIPLKALLDRASRINAAKPQRYFYPLSIATYDVEEVLAAVDSMCSFRTSMWEKTAAFEAEFGSFAGTSEAIMVNSGSSADLLIAFALVNPAAGLLDTGDEVLVPALTWPTQIWSLMMAGLKPVFVDIDPMTLSMDVDDLESKVSDRTRAISLVHLMGNPCDMTRIIEIAQSNDLIMIEDCCEALGATFGGEQVGTFGLASSFSFFFSHHLTTMEGGMICCSDPDLSDLLRLLRAHGWARNTKYLDLPDRSGIDPRYMFLNWGFNVRPTDVQAAFGLEQLRKIDDFHRQRIANATYLEDLLRDIEHVISPMRVADGGGCSWFAFPLIVSPSAHFTRSEVVEELERQGVETRPIVAGNLARHPVRDTFSILEASDLPGARFIHERAFYIGIYPFDSRQNLDRVSEILHGLAVPDIR